MSIRSIARKYQVWLAAALAAAAVELTMLLSAPSATQAAQDLGAESTAGAAENVSLASLGLPVGAMVILVLMIGSRVLRRIRRQEDAAFTPARLSEA